VKESERKFYERPRSITALRVHRHAQRGCCAFLKEEPTSPQWGEGLLPHNPIGILPALNKGRGLLCVATPQFNRHIASRRAEAFDLGIEAVDLGLLCLGLCLPPAEAVVDYALNVSIVGEFEAMAILGRVEFWELDREDAGEVFGVIHIEDYYARLGSKSKHIF
jgi:hypothetical protein